MTWVDRATPGVAALFDGLVKDRCHSVLDLGQADDSSLTVYGRFARRMRFADLLSASATGGWTTALAAVPEQPELPYDLVLAWDVLDRLPPEARPLLVARLAEVGSAHARVHLMVDASQRTTAPPLRFSLLDVNVMRWQPTGPPRPRWPQLLPAEVERVLRPFVVVRGFTSNADMREYVAVR